MKLHGASLALVIQAAATHWGWHQIRPQLEQQALSRAGLTIAIGPDGSGWIQFPEGMTAWHLADGQRLHAFEKKAKRGIATPKQEVDMVRRRLRAAEQHYRDTHRGD